MTIALQISYYIANLQDACSRTCMLVCSDVGSDLKLQAVPYRFALNYESVYKKVDSVIEVYCWSINFQVLPSDVKWDLAYLCLQYTCFQHDPFPSLIKIKYEYIILNWWHCYVQMPDSFTQSVGGPLEATWTFGLEIVTTRSVGVFLIKLSF